MIITENPAQELEDTLSSNGDAPPPSYRSEPTLAGPIEKTPAILVSESGPGPSFPAPENSLYASASASSSRSSYYTPSPSSSSVNYTAQGPALSSPFSRVPPETQAYSPFPPIFLVALSKTLAKGFPSAPPPSSTRPHPFTSHDVTEEDWLRFLNEIQASANLTQKDVDRSHLPIVSMIPIIRPLASLGVQQYMKGQKRHKVVKVVDTWNHHFFELRKLRVILMRGRTKLSGGPPAPFESSQISTDGKSPSGSMSPAPGPDLTYWDDEVFRLLVVPI